MHPDHYSQASFLHGKIPAVIGLGEGEQPNMVEMIEAMKNGKLRPKYERLIRAGANELIEQARAAAATTPSQIATYEYPDEWLVSNAEVLTSSRRLRVVPTPGHTRGHVVFNDEQNKMMFTGDHVLPHITPSVGFEVAQDGWPLRSFLDSLQLLKTLPDALMFPAHGPIRPSVHARVDELLEHHATRLDHMEHAVKFGASTGIEVATIVKWTWHDRDLTELDTMNQTMAVAETMAHLDVLVLQGRATVKTDEFGVAHYS
jgi:glyoxylase-like metal-dependent hydrolase (beta-lactamase superfamily II)